MRDPNANREFNNLTFKQCYKYINLLPKGESLNGIICIQYPR